MTQRQLRARDFPRYGAGGMAVPLRFGWDRTANRICSPSTDAGRGMETSPCPFHGRKSPGGGSAAQSELPAWHSLNADSDQLPCRRRALEDNATVPLWPHPHKLAIFFATLSRLAVINGALSNTAI